MKVVRKKNLGSKRSRIPWFFIVSAISLQCSCSASKQTGSTLDAFKIEQSKSKTITRAADLGSGDHTSFSRPTGVAAESGRLAVADTDHNRVLIWKAIPTISTHENTKTPPPELILGQTQTDQLGPTATSLNGPSDVKFNNEQILVSDSLNNRVLIWNHLPSTDGQAPDLVIGQKDLNSSTPGSTAKSLLSPSGIAVDPDGDLFIADQLNNRVLYYQGIPTSDYAAATFVIGQNSFGATEASIGPNGLNNPRGVAAANGRLAVADTDNQRVLIYHFPPTTNGSAAIRVLGQPDFFSKGYDCSATGLNSPWSVAFKGNSLYVADTNNHRVLVWNDVSSIQDNQPADRVFGQSDLSSCGQTSIGRIFGLSVDSQNYLWLSDSDNNLVYPTH